MTTPTTNDLANAKEAPTVYVDPGQILRINARFLNQPEAILFSYLPPKGKAIHDPGFGQKGSQIVHDGGDFYHYSIDTRLMHGDVGWWYFYSEDPATQKRHAKVGRFIVRDVPRSLLERDEDMVPMYYDAPEIMGDSGFDLIGLDDTKHGASRRAISIGDVLIVAGAALGITLAIS